MYRLLLAFAVVFGLFIASDVQAGETVKVCDGNTCRLVDRPVVKVVTAPVRAVRAVVRHRCAACVVVEGPAQKGSCDTAVQKGSCAAVQKGCCGKRLIRRGLFRRVRLARRCCN